MFMHADESTMDLHQAGAIAMAIFFHDVIYDPNSSTNEEDSAKLFMDFANCTNFPRALAHCVSGHILATATHISGGSDGGGSQQEDEGQEGVPGDNNARALFMDLDLAVLGRPTAAYLDGGRG